MKNRNSQKGVTVIETAALMFFIGGVAASGMQALSESNRMKFVEIEYAVNSTVVRPDPKPVDPNPPPCGEDCEVPGGGDPSDMNNDPNNPDAGTEPPGGDPGDMAGDPEPPGDAA